MITIRKYHNLIKRVKYLQELADKVDKLYNKNGDTAFWLLKYELQQLQIQIKKLGGN